jgi:hypothetical protein
LTSHQTRTGSSTRDLWVTNMRRRRGAFLGYGPTASIQDSSTIAAIAESRHWPLRAWCAGASSRDAGARYCPDALGTGRSARGARGVSAGPAAAGAAPRPSDHDCRSRRDTLIGDVARAFAAVIGREGMARQAPHARAGGLGPTGNGILVAHGQVSRGQHAVACRLRDAAAAGGDFLPRFGHPWWQQTLRTRRRGTFSIVLPRKGLSRLASTDYCYISHGPRSQIESARQTCCFFLGTATLYKSMG